VKLGRYIQSLDKLNNENKHLRLLTAGLTAALILSFMVLGGKKVVVIQQPGTLSKAIKVMESSADEAYKKQWSLAFAELIGNVTPANADFVMESIESYFDSGVYQQIKDNLTEQVADLKREQATVSFTPKSIVYEKSTGYVFVNGMQEIHAYGVKPERNDWTMEFGIKVVNYMPVVSHYDAYQGPPRTSEVREIERQQQQATQKGEER